MASIRAVEGGIRVSVRVQPRAKRTEVSGAYGDAIRIRVAAPPVEGAANKALAKFLAQQLGVPRSSVRIVRGESSRSKVLEVRGVTAEAATAKLCETD